VWGRHDALSATGGIVSRALKASCDVAETSETAPSKRVFMENPVSETLSHSVYVYRARHLVCAQAGCSPERALALMLDTADAAEVTLEQLAAKVIDGKVRFDPI